MKLRQRKAIGHWSLILSKRPLTNDKRPSSFTYTFSIFFLFLGLIRGLVIKLIDQLELITSGIVIGWKNPYLAVSHFRPDS